MALGSTQPLTETSTKYEYLLEVKGGRPEIFESRRPTTLWAHGLLQAYIYFYTR
jgi:hypothetical protein